MNLLSHVQVFDWLPNGSVDCHLLHSPAPFGRGIEFRCREEFSFTPTPRRHKPRKTSWPEIPLFCVEGRKYEGIYVLLSYVLTIFPHCLYSNSMSCQSVSYFPNKMHSSCVLILFFLSLLFSICSCWEGVL